MRTPAARAGSDGFTLIELLVVIAVMALLAGAVIMTIGPSGDDAQTVAGRFASRVAAARDEAVVGGRPVAIWVAPSGYGFERFAGGRWQPLTSKPFEPRDWGKDITAAPQSGSAARVGFDAIGLPSDGFAVVVGDGASRATVTVAANGDVAVK